MDTKKQTVNCLRSYIVSNGYDPDGMHVMKDMVPPGAGHYTIKPDPDDPNGVEVSFYRFDGEPPSAAFKSLPESDYVGIQFRNGRPQLELVGARKPQVRVEYSPLEKAVSQVKEPKPALPYGYFPAMGYFVQHAPITGGERPISKPEGADCGGIVDRLYVWAKGLSDDELKFRDFRRFSVEEIGVVFPHYSRRKPANADYGAMYVKKSDGSVEFLKYQERR
jgi:hypothetical protein